MVRVGCAIPRKLPKTHSNRFSHCTKFLDVVRVRRATPPFAQIWKIKIPCLKDFWWLVSALSNRLNSLSSEKIVSRNLDARLTSYGQLGDCAQNWGGKIHFRLILGQHRQIYNQKKRILMLFNMQLVSSKSDKIWRSYGRKTMFVRAKNSASSKLHFKESTNFLRYVCHLALTFLAQRNLVCSNRIIGLRFTASPKTPKNSKKIQKLPNWSYSPFSTIYETSLSKIKLPCMLKILFPAIFGYFLCFSEFSETL